MRLRALDADAWAAALEPAAPVAAGARSAAVGWRDGTAYWPTQFGITLDRLVLGGRPFDALVAGGTRAGDVWRLSVVARQFNGYLEYDGGTQERLMARLARQIGRAHV